MSSPVVLRATGLRVGFGGQAILPPIDFEVRGGELWGIVGRNGAGKTTVLRTLLGLLPPVSGTVERPAGGTMAYVPQRFAVDPLVPCRARDLIGEGVDQGWSFLRPWRTAEERARIAEAIEATDAEALLMRRYGDLSEGQKQRVLLARAIVARPAVLVLDEPTSAMDTVAERQTAELVERLGRRAAMGVILVSHNLAMVTAIADRILFLDADGGVVRAGTVSEVAADAGFDGQFGSLLRTVGRQSAMPRLEVPPR